MALAISVAVPAENKPKPEVSLINMADVFLKEDFQRRWLHVRSEEITTFPISAILNTPNKYLAKWICTTTFPTSAILNTLYKYLTKWIEWECMGEKKNDEKTKKKVKVPRFHNRKILKISGKFPVNFSNSICHQARSTAPDLTGWQS